MRALWVRWDGFWDARQRLLSELEFWAGVAFYGSLVVGAWCAGVWLAGGSVYAQG